MKILIRFIKAWRSLFLTKSPVLESPAVPGESCRKERQEAGFMEEKGL